MSTHHSQTEPRRLPHSHLTTLTLAVDSENSKSIGMTPTGHRLIVPILGGTFSGPRLNGTVLAGGADWVLYRSDGVMQIDVRLTLETNDMALIYLDYQGRFLSDHEAMADLGAGKTLDPESYSLATTAKFECGHENYTWLNDAIAVGIGEQSGFNPIYSIYEISPFGAR